MNLDPFETSDKARFRVTAEIRYSDLDPNEHVNHARYLIYLEEARLAFRRLLDRELGLPAQVTWPIAELTIRYRRSAVYPGSLTVELAPIHVGRTSFTLGYGIFDGDGCVVVAMNRSVCVDRVTGRPVAMGETVAARLREMGKITGN
jgi:acyl-CoA thioester hydrolase